MSRRSCVGLIVASIASFGLAALLLSFSTNDVRAVSIAPRLLRGSIPASGAINVVAAVLLDFRAFDTLGEASVIFASVATVGAVFAGSVPRRTDTGLGLLVRRAVAYLAALFLLFPVYVVLHGHLSPGGGFQGGVSLAVLIILLTVVFGTRRVSLGLGVRRLRTTESLSAAAFLLIGLVGVVQGLPYLTNGAAGFPRGDAGSLLSGGVIPLLNVVIGLKVASGLGSILFDLLSTRDE